MTASEHAQFRMGRRLHSEVRSPDETRVGRALQQQRELTQLEMALSLIAMGGPDDL